MKLPCFAIGLLGVCLLAPTGAAQQVRSAGWPAFDSAIDQIRDFTQVAAGVNHSLALRADGSLRAWGDNGFGQAFPRDTIYQRVAAGGNLSAGIRADGAVECWGDLRNTNVASLITAPVPFVDVALGAFYVVALRADGVLVVDGLVAPGPTSNDFVAVAAGVRHSLALRADGTVAAWGQNVSGQLDVPALPSGTTYTSIAGGRDHSAALLSDGTILCWGGNDLGQLDVPALPPGVVYEEVQAGNLFNVARRSDGAVVTWGFGPAGPAPVRPGHSATGLSAGATHAMVRFSDGAVRCWGGNNMLQCNIPELPAGLVFESVTPGYALRSDGQLVRWAADPEPALPAGVHWVDLDYAYHPRTSGVWRSLYAGLGSDGVIRTWGTWMQPSIPTPVGFEYVQVDIGGSEFPTLRLRLVALRSDGVVERWAIEAGETRYAQFTPPANVRYTAVTANVATSLALRSDGLIDLLDNGTPFPAPPAGIEYVKIAGRGLTVVALRSDGEVVLQGPTQLGLPLLPFGVHYVEAELAQNGGYHPMLLRRSDGILVELITHLGWRQIVPPQGESFTKIGTEIPDTNTWHSGPTSTYVGLASGCAGSQPAARLVPRDTPRVGAPLDVAILGLPNDVGFMLTGFSNTTSSFGPLPLEATPLGAPNCYLHVSTDLIEFVSGQNGAASYQLSIPPLAELIGATIYQQVMVADPAAGNAFGGVLSDAAAAVIGR